MALSSVRVLPQLLFTQQSSECAAAAVCTVADGRLGAGRPAEVTSSPSFVA